MFLNTKKVLMFGLMLSLGLLFNGCGGSSGGSDSTASSGGDTTPGIDTTLTWSNVFTDDFNRADGGLGANYTVETDPNSTLGIISNKAVYSTSVADQSGIVIYNTNVNDINSRISIKVTTGSSVNLQCIFLKGRYTTGADDGFGYAIGVNATNFFMYRFDDTDDELLEIKSITLQTNTTYILEFAFIGSTLIGYLKDSGGTILSKITVTESTYNSGKVCFDTNGTAATTVAFDDFKIEKSE